MLNKIPRHQKTLLIVDRLVLGNSNKKKRKTQYNTGQATEHHKTLNANNGRLRSQLQPATRRQVQVSGVLGRSAGPGADKVRPPPVLLLLQADPRRQLVLQVPRGQHLVQPRLRRQCSAARGPLTQGRLRL